MRNDEAMLKRLFAAARQADDSYTRVEMPGALKTRILAHWRCAEETAGHHFAVVLRVALGCAGALMLASIAWSSTEMDFESDDVMIANYELRSDVMP